MTTENENLAAELTMTDPITQARNSAHDLSKMIEGLDHADIILNEEISLIVAKIAANAKSRERARKRRRQLREMANTLEAERETEE